MAQVEALAKGKSLDGFQVRNDERRGAEFVPVIRVPVEMDSFLMSICYIGLYDGGIPHTC